MLIFMMLWGTQGGYAVIYFLVLCGSCVFVHMCRCMCVKLYVHCVVSMWRLEVNLCCWSSGDISQVCRSPNGKGWLSRNIQAPACPSLCSTEVTRVCLDTQFLMLIQPALNQWGFLHGPLIVINTSLVSGFSNLEILQKIIQWEEILEI